MLGVAGTSFPQLFMGRESQVLVSVSPTALSVTLGFLRKHLGGCVFIESIKFY